ncbi:hypothetical protein QWY28_14715 [Nocardioides sp. SOB77]|uniref:Uncharacterized protein n=1 Tax=Nocardioides oceani TaxID=3058369 RepID=A0ABT8FHP6_9ACTN|nr:hypothetical protein [Nocardioides oceani]MDN4174213.1 hypothetical protein [Nocardioides oceani]
MHLHLLGQPHDVVVGHRGAPEQQVAVVDVAVQLEHPARSSGDAPGPPAG